MAKNPEMVLSYIHEILSESLPLFVAYDQSPKPGPAKTTQYFDRIYDFSLEELSQRNKIEIMVDIIAELKTCRLNSVQVTQVKRLESLLRVNKKYSSTKLKINSLDDFLKTQMTKKAEYLQTKENYSKIWYLGVKTGEEAKRYRSEMIDTKHKLDDLKENWLQMEFQAGGSQLDLMANDIELSGLEKEYDRLLKLFNDKIAEGRKVFEKKKETNEALKGIISNSFDELANLKVTEKELACQELAIIERSWAFIRSTQS